MSANNRFLLALVITQVVLASILVVLVLAFDSGFFAFVSFGIYLILSVVNFFASQYLTLNMKPDQADPVIVAYWVLACMLAPFAIGVVFGILGTMLGAI
jgi:hypothetical protein